MEGPAEFSAWVERQAGELANGAGRGAVRLIALPVEASTRSFFRVVKGASTFIAMHSPPKTEDNLRFVRLAALFRRHGLRTPEIHASDLTRGFLLLEDLGERDFETAYAEGEVTAPLTAAVRTLVALQSVSPRAVPRYTRERFADELAIFEHWLAERLLELRVPGEYVAASKVLIEATQSVPARVVHRDFHCRNLLWSDDGDVGVVDFQDALVGPACYDIASLLRDCYHEFDEATVAKWRREYFARADLGCGEADFNRAFDLTAMQRQLKAVGIFARLHLDRRRASHLRDIVPVLVRLARLGHCYAETRPLAAWLAAEVVPRAKRTLAAKR